MTDSEKLELLISRLSPMQGECGCSGMSQQALVSLLEDCGGDVDRATYYACLRLAENTAIDTPELKTESSRDYWLSLARLYRPNKTCALGRADREASV